MIDQGASDPALAGIRTPAGVRVEIVAAQPVVVDPVAMAFADDGSPLVLEWRVGTESELITEEVRFRDGSRATLNRMRKDVTDELKRLRSSPAAHAAPRLRYDRFDVLLRDLETPSSLIVDDGWIYLSSLGRVLRRKRTAPGSPFGIEEVIVRGLCAFNQHQASGLTLSHDGWLFITSGDDDDRGEGSDGSRAFLPRTGGVFRCRPDGSQLTLFALGMRNPYRDVVFDDYFNMFHIDNDQEDGSKFQGCRLMHVLEAADYGWRLAPGAVCCRPDPERGAVFGERPGKMPSMLKTGRGAPAGLLIYQDDRFPEFFRGLLIYPDVYRKMVRAYRVERRGSTFEVVEEFVLMRSEDGLFRPCQAVAGPDGAIYIVDWRTDSAGPGWLWGDGKHGRIYRLSWSGDGKAPALRLRGLDAWAKLPDASDESLWRLLDAPSFQLRMRAMRELVRRRNTAAGFLAICRDRSRSGRARAICIGAACRFYDRAVEEAMVGLLADPDVEIRRLAADALGRNAAAEESEATTLAALIATLDDPHPAARRAVALALGSRAGRLPVDHPRRSAAARALLQALRAADRSDAFLWDGILRGLERTGETAIRLLVAAARNGDERELAVSAFEALRTPLAAAGLKDVLARADFLSPSQVERILETYRHLLSKGSIDATAVVDWLRRHPDAPSELRVTALETLTLVGDMDPARTLPAMLELLDSADPETRLAAIRLVGDNHLLAATAKLVARLRDPSRSSRERLTIVRALGKLRRRDLPFGRKTATGVERFTQDLAVMIQQPGAEPLRAELLQLLAAVDFARARPLARAMLTSKDPSEARAAVAVLGAVEEDARALARDFLAGKVDASLLPQVVAALEKHAPGSGEGETAELLERLYRGGLFLTMEPGNVRRIEALVRTKGNPSRGRSVYLSLRKGQCSQCHRLEGVGSNVGPDLTRIWETHTVEKIMESILQPDRDIKEGFETFEVVTRAGKVYTGLRLGQDDREVVLRDAQGTEITVATADIRTMTVTKTSLMPSGLVKQLSLQDFVDIVAFLKDRTAQEELRGRLTQIWTVGPFSRSLDKSEAPERGPDPLKLVFDGAGRILHWKRLNSTADSTFDLSQHVDKPKSSVYALAFLQSPTKQSVTLAVRFRDRIKLLVNDAVVLRSAKPGSSEVKVELRPGWNTVLAKVVRLDGEFRFGLTASGGTGLRFASEKQ